MSPEEFSRLAVIDVGTLKVKFEIREFDSKGHSKIVHRDKKLTVLGRDLSKNNNKIIESALHATIDALKEFKKVMADYSVRDYKAITTEAIRKASNAEEVLQRIKKEAGIALEVLTHEDEARVFFIQVAKSFPGQRLAVGDVGGGSVQLVIGHDDVIEDVYLFKTGTYFMQEEFSTSHHPTHAELQYAWAHVLSQFAPLAQAKWQVDELIYGSTNIIDFMQATKVVLKPSGHTEPHAFRAPRSELTRLYDKIIALSYEDRMPMYPNEPYYMWSADNALLNVFAFMDILKLASVIPTNENISSGLFAEMLDRMTDG